MPAKRYEYIDVVFTGPPDHDPPRFVEVEDEQGRSIGCGTWVERENGRWALRIKPEAFQRPAESGTTVWVYSADPNPDHMRVFSNAAKADEWLASNDTEGVAFGFTVDEGSPASD